ncbi:MAG: undecaprenyldiphospho-muramoylpentapeptide beta-N-acetylglucosaminyltransferase, partial [Deltaproteobacteria bacterium]|nr:undecaprenyldiphospho-muramoylpentapeptide beta-N-acetylglucosaminyltransferase [Deltaproteobacteria bacterium]
MNIMLAGGGTGGHLFPAIALAQEFKEQNETCNILFIGSKKGLEAKILSRYGFELKTLDVEGIKRKGLLEKFISLCKAVMAVWQSRKIIKMFNPDFVIGTGGYSAFPSVMAAKVMNIKTAILEQNALPGAANRLLGRFVDKVFIAFPETVKFFPEAKVIVSGNPVRKEILEVKSQKSKVKSEEDKKFTILVFGGSQGAKAINSIFSEALEYIKEHSINVINQTGDEDYERVKEAYKRVQGFKCSSVKVEVLKFIDDMAGAYKKADLIICRSGATSIAEILALGLPSILIPYPYAA